MRGKSVKGQYERRRLGRRGAFDGREALILGALLD
jgi:hypothetical protein